MAHREETEQHFMESIFDQFNGDPGADTADSTESDEPCIEMRRVKKEIGQVDEKNYWSS